MRSWLMAWLMVLTVLVVFAWLTRYRLHSCDAIDCIVQDRWTGTIKYERIEDGQ